MILRITPLTMRDKSALRNAILRDNFYVLRHTNLLTTIVGMSTRRPNSHRKNTAVPRLTADSRGAANVRHVIVVMDQHEEFNRGVLRGVVTYGRSQPSWVLRCMPTCTPTKTLLEWQPDGVIVNQEKRGLMTALEKRGIPMVVPLSETLARQYWVADDQTVGAMVAKEFLDRGLHELAIIGLPGMAWSQCRQNGFCAALIAAGRPPPHVYSVASWRERQRLKTGVFDFERKLQAWLKRLPKPVGIFAVNDAWGREAIDLCRLAGLAIPEQVAIIGVDNDEFICGGTSPELSSVVIPWDKIGYEAACSLDHIISGESAPQGQILVLPGAIVPRHSSNVEVVAEPYLAAALRFISQRACEPINVADVLRAVPVDRRWLERQCKLVLGRTPMEEIRRVRMVRATLLLSTNMPISAVAERCGYPEKRFAMVFKTEIGVTPTQWRHRRLPSKP
ncbi:MAG: XylR family transcriptional regulator [Phycisphaerae bacterium]